LLAEGRLLDHRPKVTCNSKWMHSERRWLAGQHRGEEGAEWIIS